MNIKTDKQSQSTHTTDQQPPLASRMARLQASPLRSLLNAVGQQKLISFAGGLPSPESFPTFKHMPDERSVLQYGSSEGEPELRQLIAEKLSKEGLPTQADRVLILSGSQQGIDLVAKLLIDEHTKVAVETPTYLAALQVFSLFGANYQPFNIKDLTETKNATEDNVSLDTQTKSPALLYTVPTFQNPTGVVYNEQQRQAIARYCQQHSSVLFEDDPYRELVYDDCERTPICSYLQAQSPTANWVYQSSFSKTMAPGLRIGYLVCSEALYPHLLHLKQASDLHSCRLSQHALISWINENSLEEHTQTLAVTYRRKRDAFGAALHKHFSGIATWSTPKGGLFFWLTLNDDVPFNAADKLEQALELGVAFAPGNGFYPKGTKAPNCMRLNFSYASEDEFDQGLEKLASLFKH